MFSKNNIPKKNIILKEDKYLKILKKKIYDKKKNNHKIKLINFINSWL